MVLDGFRTQMFGEYLYSLHMVLHIALLKSPIQPFYTKPVEKTALNHLLLAARFDAAFAFGC